MRSSFSFTLFVVFGWLLGSVSLEAEVAVNPLFADHMVLQRERPLPVWGKAAPGEAVTVTFAGESQSARADGQGKWMVSLTPKAASREPRELHVQGGQNRVVLKDVLVGDVWLGSGQSNMEWSMAGTDRSEAILQKPPGTFAAIRLLKVNEVQADAPIDAVSGQWTTASPEEILKFSATLFYFGEALQQRHPEVPLGLVLAAVGATSLSCWLPNEVRDEDPSAAYLRTWWAEATKGWSPEKQARRDQEAAAYEVQRKGYEQRKKNPPADLKKPGELVGPKYSRRPSALYNGMIAPLQPFALRGMIWYQGERDAKPEWVPVYHDMFVALARSLRAHWGALAGGPNPADFPIFLVQLPAREPNDGKYWPEMREVQSRLAMSVPNSGFVVTYDTNDPAEVHSPNKSPIGERLALLALAKSYGEPGAWHGPLCIDAKPEGDGLRLEFDPGSDSLKNSDGQPLRHFEVAGADGIYVPATAEIQGPAVWVASPQVKRPVTVRYAFNPAPTLPNFFNSAGLPAAPFRTDRLPLSPVR